MNKTGLIVEKPNFAEITVQQSKNNFQSKEELIYHLTHKTNNILHDDGRIYLKINSSGELFAQSISPYSETFLNNIEPKIKDLVQAFIEKRYLTYSSCEGHGLSFRRYLGLAFCDEDSRNHIKSEIMKLKLPGVYCVEKNAVSNNKIEFSEKSYYYKEKAIPDEIKEQEKESFNIQFHRNYEEYFFLEIVILKDIPYFHLNLKSLKCYLLIMKNLSLIIRKLFFVDKYTKKITELVNSEKVKKYKY
mgnify:CR=1 FL=1